MKSIYKHYSFGQETVNALSDINLLINAGEFVSIAGPSGSGKSTLLNIMGLIDKPTHGEITINKQHINTANEDEIVILRLNKIGFIFQNFNLIPVFSVYENVEYPLVLKNIPKKERKERVINILSEVGLEDKVYYKPNKLSGGQQQRVAIARALVGNPDFVLADEPTANLDSKTGEKILELMAKLNQNRKVTFVFATHDPKVMKYASRIIKLLDGKLESNGVCG